MTGATGFLGRRVLPLLGGHDVLCLSRDPERVPRHPRVTAVRADLGRDGDWTGEVSRFRPDWCLHLAWQGLPDYSFDRCRLNLDAGLRLLGAVSDAGVRRMVVAGSCWEYGRATGAVTEDREPDSVGVFAATKLALLTVLESVARAHAFDYAWARVFFVYGPGQRATSLIPTLRAAYATHVRPDVRQPGAVQDFVHVDDVAAALVGLTSTAIPSGVYNVGSGVPTSVGHVANEAARHYGRDEPFTAVQADNGFWADPAKTAAATGWRARIGIDDGIRRTLGALDEEMQTC